MSNSHYTFLPWLRKGISNTITPASGKPRAEIDVSVVVNDETSSPVDIKVQVVGPGDILGINKNMVVRTEPKNWVTDFEPNYLPFIEFYDEDFPWRYTPSVLSATARLTPWLHLLVLEESEFTRVTVANRPLASLKLKVAASAVLPDPGQLWAWAHVHVNSQVEGSVSIPDNSKLNTLLSTNPDNAASRLFSQRTLKENTAYYAFVIPSFESGRLAGLGLDVSATLDGQTRAWSLADVAGKEFPVYYEWFFRTGASGDFEYLVSLLKPRVMDANVGIRDLSVEEPGFGLDNLGADAIVGLEGALKAPTTVSRTFTDSNDRTKFEEQVQKILNLPEELKVSGSTATPLITPPFYGQWHALVTRLKIDPADENWIHALNKDPRNRSAAGLGALVVQKNQQSYMQSAWQQAGEIIEANQKIYYGQLAIEAGQMLYNKYIREMSEETLLQLTVPVHPKVMGSPTTIYQQVEESALPSSVFSRTFRRALRPSGNLMQNLGITPAEQRKGQLIGRINDGLVTAAPPKETPAGITDTVEVADALKKNIPPWKRLITDYFWLWLLLAVVIAVLIWLLMHQPWIGVVVGVVLVTALILLNHSAKKAGAGELVAPENFTSDNIRETEPRIDFVLTQPGGAAWPTDNVIDGSFNPNPGTEGERLRNALIDFTLLLEKPVFIPPVKKPLDITNAATKLRVAIQPSKAVSIRILRGIKGGKPQPEEDPIVPAMAYPDIRQPMYEPLRDISSELLLPNLNLVPPNTISLLESNQPFIEAYMTGVNHEFGRELLWNEYPTDQRGSSFRQFWDVSRVVNTQELPEEELVEQLKDISPIHTWTSRSMLGDHANRKPQHAVSESDGQLVLLVRGDVLKKYPNTVIYAQKAKWDDDAPQLSIDESLGGDIDDANIMYPSFSGSIEPDVTFIGFDLTAEQARGLVKEETQEEKDSVPVTDLGWFFVLREIPGEPRFGLDKAGTDTPAIATEWDQLAWSHLDSSSPVIDITKAIKATVGGTVQWGTNSADLASILYQKPVLIAVHARDMLTSL